jgi:hypothetical protein
VTGNQLIARCKSRFRDPDNRIVSDAVWLEHLQAGYKRVIGAALWPWKYVRDDVTVIAATSNAIALPTDVTHVESVWNGTDEHPMSVIQGPGDNWRHMYPLALSTDETGTPEHYRLFGNTIEIFPYPEADTVLWLDYVVPPTALTTSTDPLFPEEYHESILVEYALAIAYLDDGDAEKSAQHMEAFSAAVKEMMQAQLGSRTGSNAEIVDDWFER